jgi:hypothetical protein
MEEEVKSVFADLPDGDEVNDDKGDPKLKELSLALKEERRKRKEESAEREKLEAKLAEQPQPQPPAPPVDEERLRKIALEELSAKEERKYKDDLALEIKRRARSRQEAEEIYAAAISLPKNASVEMDAQLAVSYYDSRRKATETFAPPAPSGSPQAASAPPAGSLTPSALELARSLGLTDEEIKKYSGGVKL